MHYHDDRNRTRSTGGTGGGRFTQGRNGYPDQNALRAQYLLEQQAMSQGGRVSSTLPRQMRRNGGGGNGGGDEMERMRRALKSYQEQLMLADDTIQKMKKREKDMSDRVAKEVESKMQLSGKFENLSQGITRPSIIVEKYGLLYTQGRLDAMDDLDKISGLSKYGKHQEMKQKILYGIMVASYKVAHDYLQQLKYNLKKLLGIPEKHQSNSNDVYSDALTFLTTYFQATTQTFNVDPVVKEVQEQLVQLLPEFPSLSRLPGIAAYTSDCCHIAWGMVNQIPPMELEHSQEKFSENMHSRFHASSEKSTKVKMYVWPTLVDAGSKDVLYKGVVWT